MFGAMFMPNNSMLESVCDDEILVEKKPDRKQSLPPSISVPHSRASADSSGKPRRSRSRSISSRRSNSSRQNNRQNDENTAPASENKHQATPPAPSDPTNKGSQHMTRQPSTSSSSRSERRERLKRLESQRMARMEAEEAKADECSVRSETSRATNRSESSRSERRNRLKQLEKKRIARRETGIEEVKLEESKSDIIVAKRNEEEAKRESGLGFINDVIRMLRPSPEDGENESRCSRDDRLNLLEGDMIAREEAERANKDYDRRKHVITYFPTPDMGDAGIAIDDDFDIVETNREMSRRNRNPSKFISIDKSKRQGREGGPKPPTPADLATMEFDMDPQFESLFEPDDMRLLAIVAHKSMRTNLKQFVVANKNILKKFRLTGTEDVMEMLKDIFYGDREIVYGPTCRSAALGGDAQLVTMAVNGELGGSIFFFDPSDDKYSNDLQGLVRQSHIQNILIVNNATTAHMTANIMRVALKTGRIEMIPSFFYDLESPAVVNFQKREAMANAVNSVADQADILSIDDTRATRSAHTSINSKNSAHHEYMRALQAVPIIDDVVEEEKKPEEFRKPATLAQLGDHLDGHFAKPEAVFEEFWKPRKKQQPTPFTGPYAANVPVPKKEKRKNFLSRKSQAKPNTEGDTDENGDEHFHAFVESKKKGKPKTLAELGNHLDEYFD